MGVNRVSLSDEIAEDINSLILSGVYKPGDQIPNEFELAEKYNVGRFTVREAIKKLCTSGILKIERGRGTFVNKLNTVSFMKPLLPLLMLDDKDMVEICEARLAIERQTVALCAQRATKEDIENLYRIIKEMEESLKKKDYEEYNKIDLRFHLYIAKASYNNILFKILETIQDLLQAELTRTSVAPNANQNSIKRHKLIVQSIEARDEVSAATYMHEHIQDAIVYFRSLCKQP